MGWGWLSLGPASAAAPALSCCQIRAVRRLRGRSAPGSSAGQGRAKGRAPNPTGAVGELGCTITPQSTCGCPECQRCIPNRPVGLGSPRGGGLRVNPALGTLPRPAHVSSPVSRGQAWAGRWQEPQDARGYSQRRCRDAQSPSSHPAQPCCSPWLWGRCQLPEHQRTPHFSKGCSQRPGSCGHCPLLLPSLHRRVQSHGWLRLAPN